MDKWYQSNNISHMRRSRKSKKNSRNRLLWVIVFPPVRTGSPEAIMSNRRSSLAQAETLRSRKNTSVRTRAPASWQICATVRSTREARSFTRPEGKQPPETATVPSTIGTKLAVMLSSLSFQLSRKQNTARESVQWSHMYQVKAVGADLHKGLTTMVNWCRQLV